MSTLILAPIQSPEVFLNLQENPEQPKKSIEVLQANKKENGFSVKKYFLLALVIGAIAGAIFSICLPASIALMTLASWYLWSTAIIVINCAAEGTCLEKAAQRLHALSMEVNSSVAAAGLFPLTFFKSYHRPQGDLKGRPILMVNGYLSFGSTWHYQRKRLVQAGLGPVYTMNVGSGKSIKTYAKQVEEKALQIQKETGRNDLAIIGHSKGGLVSSYYTTYLASKMNTNVTDVITIGSPLSGTPFAYLGLGKDAHEMRTSAPFHRELRAKMNECTQTRFFHIASKSDAIVSLSSSLLGKDPSKHFVLKDIGHLSLVFSSRVADQIHKWLK